VCVSDEFNIYTREAGAGILSVAVEGPSQAKIEMTDNPNGYTMISYTVTKEGWACTVEYRPVIYNAIQYKLMHYSQLAINKL